MTLQLEKGKFYRTRDGRKVGPVRNRNNGSTEHPFDVDHRTRTHDADINCTVWSAFGSSFDGRHLDLVAEWGALDAYEEYATEREKAKREPAREALDLLTDTPEHPADIKATILDQAGKIVNGARRSAYGAPENNFERIAKFWQAYIENCGLRLVDANGEEHKFGAGSVSPMMRLIKEARLCETPDHYDSFVDIVGYTLTGAEVNRVKSA